MFLARRLLAWALLVVSCMGQVSVVHLPGFNSSAEARMGQDPTTGEIRVVANAGSLLNKATLWRVQPFVSPAPRELLPATGPDRTDVTGISPSGRFVIGHRNDRGFGSSYSNPVLWDLQAVPPAALELLPPPVVGACGVPGVFQFDVVSDNGVAAGRPPSDLSFEGFAYRWSASGGWVRLDDHPTSNTGGSCFQGIVVGISPDGSEVLGGVRNQMHSLFQPAIWDGSGSPRLLDGPRVLVTEVGDAVSPRGMSSDGEVITAVLSGPQRNPVTRLFERHAVVYIDEQPMIVPPEATRSGSVHANVTDATSSGWVVGRHDFPYEPFIWRVGDQHATPLGQFLHGTHGVQLPWPGVAGATGYADQVVKLIDDGLMLHLLIVARSLTESGTRHFVVSVPSTPRPAAGIARTSAGLWLMATTPEPSLPLTQVFSADTLGAVGSGPFLGLAAVDPSLLVSQAQIPVEPFRVGGGDRARASGPWTLPPGLTLDLVSIIGAWPNYGAFSEVHRFVTP